MFQRTVIDTGTYESMKDQLEDERDKVLADNLVKYVCARFQKTAHRFEQDARQYTATFPGVSKQIAFKHLECLHQQDPRQVECVTLEANVCPASLPAGYVYEDVIKHKMYEDEQKRAVTVDADVEVSVCVNKYACALSLDASGDQEERDATPYFPHALRPLDLGAVLTDERDRELANKLVAMMHCLYEHMPLLTTHVDAHEKEYALVISGYTRLDSRALSRVHRDMSGYIVSTLVKAHCQPYAVPMRTSLSVHLRVRKCSTPATISFVDMSLCTPFKAGVTPVPATPMPPAPVTRAPPVPFAPPRARPDVHEWARAAPYDLPPPVDALDEHMETRRRSEKRKLHALIDASPLPTDTEDGPEKRPAPHRALQRLHDEVQCIGTRVSAIGVTARSLF